MFQILYQILINNIQEILTFLLVIITGIYVWLTHGILNANKKVIAVMKSQMDAINRPYINIRTFKIPSENTIFLEIKNTGKSSAFKLKLEFDRDFYVNAQKKEGWNVAQYHIFQNEIDCFPPDTNLAFRLAPEHFLFQKDADQSLIPIVFQIKATYQHLNNTYIEVTIIDLKSYLGSENRDSLIYKLDDIKNVLSSLNDSIKKIKI